MNRFHSLRRAGLVLVAVAALAHPDRASAEDRAYQLRGSAQFVSPTEFVGAGYATHLGRYSELGSASFSGTHVEGWAILTAANDGDQLFETISGELDPATGVITATVTFVGGTGRFADATGSATLVAQLLPGGRIAVTVQGTIDY